MDSMARLNEAIFFWINRDGGHHYVWLDVSMVSLSDSANGVIPFVLVVIFSFLA